MPYNNDSNKDSNVVWHSHPVDRELRSTMKQQQPGVIWMTGLSASGKSTLAGALEQVLARQGYHTYLLDGDNVRHGLCGDLGFSVEDRRENIRRVGEVSRLMVDAGLIVLAAFISPFQSERRLVRDIIPPGHFIEVFVDSSLDTCKERDPKGLYRKAMSGEIKEFTGIDSPYEVPARPELHVHTDRQSISECLNTLLGYLDENGFLEQGYHPVPVASD